MVRPRGISGALLVVVVACAPHERPQEPSAPCPTGMAVIGGDAEGSLAVGRVCMDLTEVTTAAYGACVQAGVCTPAIVGTGGDCNLTKPDRGDHPINCAAWEQAQTFCGWLGKRLPDDEEWIWAAQGGAAMTPYPWGRTPPDAARACWDRKALGTCPVGGLAGGASPAGIFDLVGNAAEWTRGRGPATAGGRGRLRGGSFLDSVYKQPIDERFADSARDDPAEAATVASGLRCVVAPHTPVQEVDTSKWAPHVPGAGGLPPVLAAAEPTDAPVRPLANLAILERPQAVQDAWWSAGDRVIPIQPALAATLGLRDHLQRNVQPAALKGFVPLRWLGDIVLLTNQSSYDFKLAAVEPTTFRLRWQAAPGTSGRTFAQVVTPRTLVVSFTGDAADSLAAYALDSGREVWRIRGVDDPNFRKVQSIFADGERGYVIGEAGLVAFDANTGATLWTGVALAEGCGATAAAGVLIAEDAGGYRVLDPASGQLQRTLGKPGGCGWSATSWDRTIPAGVIAEGRLLAFEPRAGGEEAADTATLRAFDLATGAERWRRIKLGTTLLVADHDAVYVARGGDRLLALDASDGTTQAEIGFASGYALTVQPGGGEAGPLVVVDAPSTGQWILGRAPAPEPAEAWVVRGRLRPDDYLPRGSASGVPVKVSEKIVRTDARGRFEARGEGRGALLVALGTERGPDRRGGSKVTFSETPVILDGSKKYDLGDIALTEWSLY